MKVTMRQRTLINEQHQSAREQCNSHIWVFIKPHGYLRLNLVKGRTQWQWWVGQCLMVKHRDRRYSYSTLAVCTSVTRQQFLCDSTQTKFQRKQVPKPASSCLNSGGLRGLPIDFCCVNTFTQHWPQWGQEKGFLLPLWGRPWQSPQESLWEEMGQCKSWD